MSDLQCPATFHVFGPAALPENLDLVHGAPIAAVHAAPGRDLTDVAAGPAEPDPWPRGDRPLWEVLEDLADLHRGRHVLVLAGRVEAPLESPGDVLVARLDADGRTVSRPT